MNHRNSERNGYFEDDACITLDSRARASLGIIHALKVRNMISAARGIARLGRSPATASIYSSIRQREVTARVGET